MTSFIERIRTRSEAFQLLGLSESAAPGEIRAAWRRMAFEVHPDRTGGDYSDFMRAKAAYDLVRDDAAPHPDCAAVRPRRNFRTGAAPAGGARPRVATRRTPLTLLALKECRALLREMAGHSENDGCGNDGNGGGSGQGSGALHLPEAVERQGRSLTYIVPTPLVEGLNRVALPTALLEDNRKVRPRILTVRAAQSGAA